MAVGTQHSLQGGMLRRCDLDRVTNTGEAWFRKVLHLLTRKFQASVLYQLVQSSGRLAINEGAVDSRGRGERNQRSCDSISKR